MIWRNLIARIDRLDGSETTADGPEVRGISYDSRTVERGDLYVAIPGLTVHGDNFIQEAIARGAVAVVSENARECSVPWVRVADARKALARLSMRLWRVSFDDMTAVGITGTNGKTTVAHLVLEQVRTRYGGRDCWMFGTVAYVLGNEQREAVHTTPESCDLLRLIGEAPNRPKALVMEISSEGLALNRVEGFTFDVAVWTNLTQDHLNFHKTMESYYEAKRRLFTDHIKENGTAVINIDDPRGKELADELSAKHVVTFGAAKQAGVRIVNSVSDWSGTMIELSADSGNYRLESRLAGVFNVANLAAAGATGIALGLDEDAICRAARQLGVVPGRMELLDTEMPFRVVVDYAHTPDALVNVLSAARRLTRGRILCVFGCGGDRDAAKRPLMADAVARNADEAVVTSDNPRTELPDRIIDDIVRGIPLDFPHQIVPDRREAIKAALRMAGDGDCVVIAGKGHESYQVINGVRHHFDDRETALALVREMEGASAHA